MSSSLQADVMEPVVVDLQIDFESFVVLWLKMENLEINCYRTVCSVRFREHSSVQFHECETQSIALVLTRSTGYH